jgi:hypothetical protein
MEGQSGRRVQPDKSGNSLTAAIPFEHRHAGAEDIAARAPCRAAGGRK